MPAHLVWPDARLTCRQSRLEALKSVWLQYVGGEPKSVARFRELGYLYVTVDLQGFRSGSANELLRWIAKK